MSSRSVFSWGGPSVAVVEGLTMYLPEERVSGLMRDLAAFCGRDGRIIFSFMEADESGSIQFRGESPLIDRWLGSCGEPFLWGISRADLPNFLRLSGLSNRELVDHMSLRSEILAPLELSHVPLAKGECLCLATPYSP